MAISLMGPGDGCSAGLGGPALTRRQESRNKRATRERKREDNGQSQMARSRASLAKEPGDPGKFKTIGQRQDAVLRCPRRPGREPVRSPRLRPLRSQDGSKLCNEKERKTCKNSLHLTLLLHTPLRLRLITEHTKNVHLLTPV